MNTKQIADLVTSAIDLDRTIGELTQELNELKARLVDEARAHLSEVGIIGQAVPEERSVEGSSYTFQDDAGQSAVISFPVPGLIRSFWLHQERAYRKKEGETIEIPKLVPLAGKHFGKLFAVQYKPAKAFRELCPVLLGAKGGPPMVDLCCEPSSPRVSFKTKA